MASVCAICRFSLAALLGAASLPSAARAGNPAPLLRYVPPSANAILLMDADAVKKTKLAVRHGWTEKHKSVAADRPLFLPPEADAIAVASQLDVTNEFAQEWELAVVSVQKPFSMASIAKAEGGYTESIGGLETAWTPSEAYFVGLDPKTLGVMYPANRQAVSRWASAARRSTGAQASEYLQAAAKRLGPGTQVVLALDLKDVIPPHVVHQAVMETDVIKAKPEKRQDIARIIAGIQGITLTMEIDVLVRCTFHFDFSESSAPFANFAKPMLIEILNRMNLALPETEKFTVDLKGNSALFSGQVPTTTLRRVFSLLEIPTTKFSSLDEAAEATGSSATPQSPSADTLANASLDYFHSVQALIDDLRSTLEDTRDNHAVWMERYGRKVDRLPILNVDDELLAWGAAVGETFRAMALAQRDAGIKSGARKSAVYGNYYYQYDNYGYYSARSSQSVRSQINAEERAKAKTVRFDRWKDLEDATAAIRKSMTQKYQREF